MLSFDSFFPKWSRSGNIEFAGEAPMRRDRQEEGHLPTDPFEKPLFSSFDQGTGSTFNSGDARLFGAAVARLGGECLITAA
jgi:hypothetical protein